ncbi:NUDIX hydrolase [Corynebacterium timonense]|uniref:ADP-ribose pyrophosphatase YjhB, NUDIX family n=1 Tax=Corynebacterium timonense TaxID=441500 RepID=A0A1H1PUE6_9CORY|nr:NUDIX hydrolase [Corynebacterium timonense]SDS14754.1 ADP-ribose pyrophosphatase YjhB, NUDIX family [Corynebacterium timonense]
MRGWHSLNVAERRMHGPSVAVSTVAFSLAPPHRPADTPQGLWVPLVQRTRPPYKGAWALPGGPTQWDKTLTQTARETLVAATQAEPNYLEQLYAFGSVERSAQAERTVTIAYWAQYRESDFESAARIDDPHVAWFPTSRLPELAFDHAEIIHTGIQRLQRRASQTFVAHRFLERHFTLAQLREVHEVIVDKRVDPANFRRQALSSGEIVETGVTQAGAKHRPAKFYRFADNNARQD